MSKLQDRLNALPTDSLRGIRRGVEKEGLRVQPTGGLALTPHPKALGSALTHPLITTDYSKAHGLATFDSSFTTTWLATLAASGITATESMFDTSILPEVFAGKTSI